MDPDSHDEDTHLSRETFVAFSRFIERETGIKMPDVKSVMLRGRLQRRVKALGLGSFEDYRRLVFDSPAGRDELIHLIDAVTTNKTDFFRESRQFDHLSRHTLPSLTAAAKARVNVWCAGCASGEEAYTLAMVLTEHANENPGFDFAILATDISTRVLEHARSGIYDAERVEPVPPSLRARYVLRSKDPSRKLVRMAPALRQRISFHRLNFMNEDYGVRDTFDVVFFRNVAIYFDAATQEAVVKRLCRHLRPGGHLFFGQSESIARLSVPLEAVGPSIYRRR